MNWRGAIDCFLERNFKLISVISSVFFGKVQARGGLSEDNVLVNELKCYPRTPKLFLTCAYFVSPPNGILPNYFSVGSQR